MKKESVMQKREAGRGMAGAAIARVAGLGVGLLAAGMLVTGPGVAQTVIWDGSGDMNWGPPPDATSWGAGTYNNGNTARFTGSGTGTVNVDAGGVSPGAVQITSGSYTFTGGGIGGGGALTMSGGPVVLAASNSFSGGISISAGTLESQINGALGSGTVTLSTSGNLLFSTTDQQINNAIVPGNRQLNVAANRTATLSGSISGTTGPDVNFGGSGTLVLAGNNSHGGTTLLRNGTLGLASDTAFGSSTLQVASSPCTLTTLGAPRTYSNNWIFNGGNTITVTGLNLTLTGIGQNNGSTYVSPATNVTTTLSGNTTFSGRLRLGGLGTLVLSGNSTGSGGTALESAGTLVVGSDTALGTGSLYVSGGPGVLRATNGNRTVGAPLELRSSIAYDGTTGLNLIFNAASGNKLWDAARTVTVNGSGVLTINNLGESYAATAHALVKSGGGTMVLTGTNGYSGATTVSGGTLLVNAVHSGGGSGSGTYTVQNGGTLGGSGRLTTATSTIQNGGVLSPGARSGTLTAAGNLTMQNGSTCVYELNDLVDVNGTLDLDDNWTLQLTGSGFMAGGQVTLFKYGTLAASPDLSPTYTFSNLGFTPGSLTMSNDTANTRIVLLGIRPWVAPAGTVITIR